MTWSDPIVDEVRRARDAYAARFNYDLRAIYRDLKEQEKRSGLKFVSFADEVSVVAPVPQIGVEPKKSRDDQSGRALTAMEHLAEESPAHDAR